MGPREGQGTESKGGRSWGRFRRTSFPPDVSTPHPHVRSGSWQPNGKSGTDYEPLACKKCRASVDRGLRRDEKYLFLLPFQILDWDPCNKKKTTKKQKTLTREKHMNLFNVSFR